MDTPVLRMARPLNVDQERVDDDVLDKLLRWATTVVRLPLKEGAAERLGHDIIGYKERDGRETDAFPAHFQLFSSHVGQVLLHDERTMPPARREISIERKDNHRTLKEVARGAKQTTEQWKVFSASYSPAGEAADSAGELHGRPVLEVSWAVPEYTVRNGLYTVPVGKGAFWAFFPTKYEVSLTGILNAPWKTNEDRQHLLDGSPFNREMLQVAARLVIDTLPALMPDGDPAAYLPCCPAEPRRSSTGRTTTSSVRCGRWPPNTPLYPTRTAGSRSRATCSSRQRIWTRNGCRSGRSTAVGPPTGCTRPSTHPTAPFAAAR